jgi:steroid delta-isomerase-like uncharacterized protein
MRRQRQPTVSGARIDRGVGCCSPGPERRRAQRAAATGFDPNRPAERRVTMTTQDNAKVVRQMFDAWNAHDPERLVKLLEEKYVSESDTNPGAQTGRDAARQLMTTYVRAFPDLHFDVTQVLSEGEFVVARWTVKGTHRGELMGIPPTNRCAVTNGCSVTQLKNGKAVHAWVYWDTGHLMRQLGLAK